MNPNGGVSCPHQLSGMSYTKASNLDKDNCFDDNEGLQIDNSVESDYNETSDLVAKGVIVGHVRLTWQNVLSFSFFTLSTLSSVLFTFVPFVLFTYSILYQLTERWFFSLPLSLLRLVGLFCNFFALSRARSLVDIRASGCPREKQECAPSIAIYQVMFWALLSCSLHGLLAPSLFLTFRDSFFYEVDGTLAIEWQDLEQTFFIATAWSCFAAFVDFNVALLGLILLICRGASHRCWSQSLLVREYYFELIASEKIHRTYKTLVSTSLFFTIVPFILGSISSYTYLGSHEPPVGSNIGPYCDPLDTTECLFPFPSSFFTREDNSTATKRRVDISAEALSTMYKGGPVLPSFLNDLDGFSTIGPILFYLKGMRESNGRGLDNCSLIGPEEIHMSTSSSSLTLLVDVNEGILVHHFAEIDSMDAKQPSIILQPAGPLRHNSTYAVVLLNAVGVDGRLLPASSGFRELMGNVSSSNPLYTRSSYFKMSLLPALFQAAPWLGADMIEKLQILFDFHTVSAESQLGVARKARDKALRQVSAKKWGGWGDHNVRVIKTVDGQCERQGENIARVVHAELDVPWYLQLSRPRHRASSFNLDTLLAGTGEPDRVMPVKFIVLVPCSLVYKANPTELTSVVDFGHGFLYSREELLDNKFLHRMANENGYVFVASNWRGMSDLDVPVVLKTFIAEPNLFKAARDNMIQGFADKAVIQHFCRNGLLQMDFMKFHYGKQIKLKAGTIRPNFIFYGISQGGILGAGYSSLVGPNLIDRSILVSPGTPFALLMSRSDIFPFYKEALLLHLYTLRHVRVVISLMQMAWDSVEVSGVLAPPITELHPQTLIQSGLGDSTVTTYGAEILSRAFNSTMFSSGPRSVFGLPTIAENLSPGDTESVLTELLYRKEYESLPLGNSGVKPNNVHWCTQIDRALQAQIVEFISSGRVIDPCIDDKCIRLNATC